MVAEGRVGEGFARALAGAVRAARRQRGLSVMQLTEASGVSRAMIAKIERAEVQPTAALLAKLAAGLGVTLSELIARAETPPGRLARADGQSVWTDPETGYRRRAVSPGAAGPLELVEVELPPGVSVTYPAEAYRRIDQQIWVLDGELRFQEGQQVHRLEPGDCLQLGAPSECTFSNPGLAPCRYLVALVKQVGPRS